MQQKSYDVLIVAHWAAPLLDGTGPAGGSERQLLMLAQALAAGGLKVALIVLGDRTTPRAIEGVDVVIQRRPPRLRFAAGLIHDLGTLAVLLRIRARTILARNAGRVVWVAALAARLRRARFVYSAASVTDFEFERVDRRYNVRLFEYGLRAADEVVVQGEEQAAACRERLHRDAVVIPSLVEPANPRNGRPDAFLWIGRLAPYKRLDVYLDLARAVPEAKFQVIAAPASNLDVEADTRLRRARHELPNVEVLAPRPHDELIPLVERAVAIVSTSDFEGMPNVFLEGWARGVPALAFAHDPDGVITRYRLGGFADGSRERLVELARAQWASRGDQLELSERCISYIAERHQWTAISRAWREVLSPQ